MTPSATYRFSAQSVDYFFGGRLSSLSKHCQKKSTVLLMDETVHALHGACFKDWDILTIPSGEQYKVQSTVDRIIGELIERKADRSFTLVGVGGGVVTDLTGYAASVYMRGISFGFLPTTLLAMVDASIGGKNGIDVGAYKNMVGVIRQPGSSSTTGHFYGPCQTHSGRMVLRKSSSMPASAMRPPFDSCPATM